MALFEAMEVEIVGGIAGHPQAFHDRARGVIEGNGKRDDLPNIKPVEPVLDGRRAASVA
jgi:hypothetical protein